ncbi:hypothetical protein JZ751_017852 [Albula glossodonta]|uniref:CAPS C2 domain-containing protein n=1 Tax=Albula glossodonta TaxID=121402 RepID=A0A8T2PPJ6_9TELE|nr:hypothetical protein JZ751_017852 [Albula glossodonta]
MNPCSGCLADPDHPALLYLRPKISTAAVRFVFPEADWGTQGDFTTTHPLPAVKVVLHPTPNSPKQSEMHKMQVSKACPDHDLKIKLAVLTQCIPACGTVPSWPGVLKALCHSHICFVFGSLSSPCWRKGCVQPYDSCTGTGAYVGGRLSLPAFPGPGVFPWPWLIQSDKAAAPNCTTRQLQGAGWEGGSRDRPQNTTAKCCQWSLHILLMQFIDRLTITRRSSSGEPGSRPGAEPHSHQKHDIEFIMSYRGRAQRKPVGASAPPSIGPGNSLTPSLSPVSQYTFAMCSYREKKAEPQELLQLDGYTVDYTDPQPGLDGGRAFFNAVKEGDTVIFASDDEQDRILWVQAMYRATGQSHKPVPPTQVQKLNAKGGTAPQLDAPISQFSRSLPPALSSSVSSFSLFLCLKGDLWCQLLPVACGAQSKAQDSWSLLPPL